MRRGSSAEREETGALLKNLWGDRWGKGKEESGTSDYILNAHMYACQP